MIKDEKRWNNSYNKINKFIQEKQKLMKFYVYMFLLVSGYFFSMNTLLHHKQREETRVKSPDWILLVLMQQNLTVGKPEGSFTQSSLCTPPGEGFTDGRYVPHCSRMASAGWQLQQ